MTVQATTMRVALDEVFKTNFSIFDGYEDAVRKEQITKLNYIEKIAHQLEKNLTGVNLFEIFTNNNNILLADEAEINTVLIGFNRAEYFTEPDAEHVIVTLNDDQTVALKKVYADAFERTKRDHEAHIRSHIESASRTMNDYHEHMSHAADRRQQLAQIQMEDASPMIDSLNQVLADPRFEFDTFRRQRMENDTIDFKIKDDIILTHVNERAGINLRVNLGKLTIRLYFRNGMTLTVHKNGDNVMSGGHYHPHLNGSGKVCLGNMSEIYQESMRKGDIHGMFNAVMAVMTNYNDGDPYVNLANFATASRQVQPDGTTFVPQPRNQIVGCHECDEEFEVEFQPEGESDYAREECPECEYEGEYEYYYD